MASGNDQCPHIGPALASGDMKDVIVNKYKSVVSWNAYRSSNVKNPAKRRKVSCIRNAHGLCEVNSLSDRGPDLWLVRPSIIAPLRMFALPLYWVLVGQSYSFPPRRKRTLIL